MSQPVSEVVHGRILSNPTKVAYTGTAGKIGPLAPGLYYLTSDQDCYFLQGGSAVAATSSSNPLWQKERARIRVKGTGSDEYVSAIQVSAGGTIWATKSEA